MLQQTSRPKYYNFEQQQVVAEEGERAFCNYMGYLKRKNVVRLWEDVTLMPDYQAKDIDFVVTMPDGEKVCWEVKCDTYTTGNLFAETMVNSYYLTETGCVRASRHTQGWIYKSCADMIFYYFSNLHVAYLFPKKDFCFWLDKSIAAKRPPYFRISAAPNKNNREDMEIYYGVGLLIPLRLLDTDPEIHDKVQVIPHEQMLPQPKFIVPVFKCAKK